MIKFFAWVLLILPWTLQAAYTVKGGKLIPVHELATLSVQEHYSLAKEALSGGNWTELIRQCRILEKNFWDSPFAEEVQFYQGLSYFHMQELDLANRHFSIYLGRGSSPKFFEEAMQYKFLIAQAFEKGARKRIFGQEGMPKWVSGRQEAIKIYDEVIAAFSQHELAMQSLLGKGNLLCMEKDFKEGIDTFQILLRRFPKSSGARDSYIAITKAYRDMSEEEYADPDYLDLARINVRKFQADFPMDPRIAEAELIIEDMCEVFAKDLYRTAQFFERTKKHAAALIYYNKIISMYPNTPSANKSHTRVTALEKKQLANQCHR